VSTPPASQSDSLDTHWGEIADDCDHNPLDDEDWNDAPAG
jgi:hypothetical protein